MKGLSSSNSHAPSLQPGSAIQLARVITSIRFRDSSLRWRDFSQTQKMRSPRNFDYYRSKIYFLSVKGPIRRMRFSTFVHFLSRVIRLYYWGQILLADRPRGVEQPRKKLELIKKRAGMIKNSPHAKNTTPGFRSILAWASPRRGWGILNFPDFVPRIRYTWYALVFVIGVLSVLHEDLRDVTFRCSVQYRWR